ncbi:MAG: hypothetical protein K2M11_08665 [Paramuribaculum sp.]|nr:hypothetical protein [Paramuribaculum sp.]
MENNHTEHESYLATQESQLDMVYSKPSVTGDYTLSSIEDGDEITYLYDTIEDAEENIDFLEEEDNAVKQFFKLK